MSRKEAMFECALNSLSDKSTTNIDSHSQQRSKDSYHSKLDKHMERRTHGNRKEDYHHHNRKKSNQILFRGFTNRYTKEKLIKEIFFKSTSLGLSSFLLKNKEHILKTGWQREIRPRQRDYSNLTSDNPISVNFKHQSSEEDADGGDSHLLKNCQLSSDKVLKGQSFDLGSAGTFGSQQEIPESYLSRHQVPEDRFVTPLQTPGTSMPENLISPLTASSLLEGNDVNRKKEINSKYNIHHDTELLNTPCMEEDCGIGVNNRLTSCVNDKEDGTTDKQRSVNNWLSKEGKLSENENNNDIELKDKRVKHNEKDRKSSRSHNHKRKKSKHKRSNSDKGSEEESQRSTSSHNKRKPKPNESEDKQRKSSNSQEDNKKSETKRKTLSNSHEDNKKSETKRRKLSDSHEDNKKSETKRRKLSGSHEDNNESEDKQRKSSDSQEDNKKSETKRKKLSGSHEDNKKSETKRRKLSGSHEDNNESEDKQRKSSDSQEDSKKSEDEQRKSSDSQEDNKKRETKRKQLSGNHEDNNESETKRRKLSGNHKDNTPIEKAGECNPQVTPGLSDHSATISIKMEPEEIIYFPDIVNNERENHGHFLDTSGVYDSLNDDKSSIQNGLADSDIKSENVLKIETFESKKTNDVIDLYRKKESTLMMYTSQWLSDVDENYVSTGNPFTDLCQFMQAMNLDIWEDSEYPEIYAWEVNMRRMFVSLFTEVDLEKFTRDIHNNMRDYPDLSNFISVYKLM
ncbi:uncharacterized protein MAL13P1.304-like isoform X2 [Homarus americanus]|uniref:uncharacterized protein MAL13P1.304-like isoform X2 n=1 Tax=Homarus americanus TaxID=6706 RepID=UPI001C492DC7|nr:uncharacterized protein MAL13P1.304-like isoform X2 [Homarus americanus]